MLLYYKVSQPVPGKGDAWVYYECNEAFEIQRQMTHIPATGEIVCVQDPVVKKMTNMAYMTQTDEDEFTLYWSDEHVREPEAAAAAVPTNTTGEPHFNLDMTINEAMSMHPRVAEVFAAFHLGGCAHCGISQVETIGQVCAAYGVDGEYLIDVLEDLMKNAEGSPA